MDFGVYQMSPLNKMSAMPIVGPWKGVITDLPSGFDPTAWDVAKNFLFRKGRIQSRPKIVAYAAVPPDGQPIRAMYSFLDALNSYHTLVLTNLHAYFLTNPGGGLVFNALTLPSGFTDLGGSNVPFALIEMNQQVFFSNGLQNLLYVDGSDTVKIAGDVPGGCKFLTENSSHLIGVYWNIPSPGILGSQTYPFYVLISDAGNPLEWTPSSSNSAVILNLIEKGGTPSGAVTLGNYTYIWRQYGANVLWPTGNQAAPFYNEPFTWSNPGWGNFYPYSIATWNQSCIMATHGGEILLFNGAAGPSAQGFQPLAQGKIKKSITADLALAAGDAVFGFVTDILGPGYDFVAYVLWIPGLNKAWVLNLEEMTWSWWTSSNKHATAFGNVLVH